ncbi:Flp family type IVb pilin [Streptomyces flavochromogenes]|uniref:Flp family type IVb pilin n=1 Tax=Streptomyces flavochromogenes TaxID=68199 RepID=A0ABW6XLF5_9ACTN
MNDAMLKALTKARLELATWTRSRGGDRGQTAVEYLGIIVVVVAIVVAISGTGLGSTILTAIENKIAELTAK